MIAAKAALVIAAACAVSALLRRQSASFRHAALACGFAFAAILPILSAIVPAWGTLTSAPIVMLSDGSGEWRNVRLLWLAGAASGLLVLAARLLRVVWLRSRARVAGERCQAMVDDVAREFGIRRHICVLETARRTTPLTWGVVWPKILLPSAASEWSDECVRAVIRHELAHVQRGDWAVQLAAAAIARVFWFNPLMWAASRWLRVESERACDDAVLNLGVDGTEYAAHLIFVARTLKQRRAAVPAAVAASGFERRIALALDRTVDRTPLSACAGALLAIAVASVAIPVAGFGEPKADGSPSLLGVQRDVLRRFGGEERRFSIASGDIAFLKTRMHGRVELQARLNVDGSVSAVRILEPAHPDLANAAEVIVRHWRREPARVRGVPVEVPIRMTVDFTR